jgi:hypothetical protein
MGLQFKEVFMKSQFAQNRAARWMAHVRRWQESGLGKTRYCRENGLALSTFQYWITKSRPSFGSESASIPALVPLPFVFAAKTPSIGLMVSNRYAMDIPADFDEATLTRLLSVLESRC